MQNRMNHAHFAILHCMFCILHFLIRPATITPTRPVSAAAPLAFGWRGRPAAGRRRAWRGGGGGAGLGLGGLDHQQHFLGDQRALDRQPIDDRAKHAERPRHGTARNSPRNVWVNAVEIP